MKLLLSAIAVVLVTLGAQQVVMATEGEAVSAAQDVESTLIKSVAYDPATQVLTLVLVSGDETYEYMKVPEDVYKELMAAESKGSYFAKNIKGKYDFTKK